MQGIFTERVPSSFACYGFFAVFFSAVDFRNEMERTSKQRANNFIPQETLRSDRLILRAKAKTIYH